MASTGVNYKECACRYSFKDSPQSSLLPATSPLQNLRPALLPPALRRMSAVDPLELQHPSELYDKRQLVGNDHPKRSAWFHFNVSNI